MEGATSGKRGLTGKHLTGKKMEKSNAWKGGFKRTRGYRYILMPTHPNAIATGYVLEHVAVMSAVLGRPIEKHEIIHHVNENKLDNRPENLQIMTRAEHLLCHLIEIKTTCGECGEAVAVKTRRICQRYYCSKSCKNKASLKRCRKVRS